MRQSKKLKPKRGLKKHMVPSKKQDGQRQLQPVHMSLSGLCLAAGLNHSMT